ncbi:hypothetical protein CDAR_52031 [Caerostris darwini]|uniref:Uncharacterized protein n=1 Tax=Caerostris darwini TaxID=1538125 RepID=A0AAV4R5R8_9ARAC|nr:hypothetical protein CDAR_52031 [Caerostris darwini]
MCTAQLADIYPDSRSQTIHNSSTRHQHPHLHLHSTPPFQVRKVMCSRLPEPTLYRRSDFSETSKRRHMLHCGWHLHLQLQTVSIVENLCCGRRTKRIRMAFFFCSRLLFHLVESFEQLFVIQERKVTVAVSVGALW